MKVWVWKVVGCTTKGYRVCVNTFFGQKSELFYKLETVANLIVERLIDSMGSMDTRSDLQLTYGPPCDYEMTSAVVDLLKCSRLKRREIKKLNNEITTRLKKQLAARKINKQVACS